jgi:chemotaxis protein histidine kinase CheA
VDFEIVGEDTLVDKTVAERLYEPLAHQIRNAVDHGLEDPLVRQHVGKQPTGKLVLSAYKKEEFTYVSVRDDGKGLDYDLIRQIAIEKDLAPAGTILSPERCQELIMSPGFSTTREATEISGRGVGMDVVKSTVEALGGEVIVDTAPGQGSEFTYKIPQLSAVNITDAVIIRAGDGFFAVPVGNVVATHSIRKSEINTTMGRSESIMYLNTILPLHDLLQLLTGRPIGDDPASEAVSIIIVEAKNGRIACRVSEFIRPQKLVLIPLPDGFKASGISGTTILGGSQLGMIIDPFQLIAMATGTTLDPNAALAFGADSIPLESGLPEIPPIPGPPDKATGPAVSGSAAENNPLPPLPATEMGDGLAEQFFIEIGDILKELNEDIFQLEKEPESATRINTIFRHFHSIKGNFMMTGFTGIGAFVHEVESVLDRVREKKLAVDQGIIDMLLDSVKILETGLSEIRAGRGYEVADPELLAALKNCRLGETTVTEKPEQTDSSEGNFQFSPLGQLLYHAKMADPCVNICQGMIAIQPSFQDASLLAYLIIRRLTMVADVIDSVPSLERIEKGVVKDRIKIMFASRLSLEEINRFFRNQLQRHYSVGLFEIMIME